MLSQYQTGCILCWHARVVIDEAEQQQAVVGTTSRSHNQLLYGDDPDWLVPRTTVYSEMAIEWDSWRLEHIQPSNTWHGVVVP
jgi:hypothetical protein